jgi:polyhydroxyalkanoate synthesis repressor PhaR
MSTPKIVKRYANRKLYDTEHSCYVTLEDISAMIKSGDEVQVVDNKSGEDLTSVTLAQIIFEAEKKKNFMPIALLRDLIRDGGDVIGEFAREQREKVETLRDRAEKLTRETTERADRLRQDFRDRFEGVMHRKANGKENQEETVEADEHPRLLADMLQTSQKAFDEFQKGVKDRVGTVSRYAHLDKEMDEISERLASLEQRLGKM